MVKTLAQGRLSQGEPDYIARAETLAKDFAARAIEHDRTASFPF